MTLRKPAEPTRLFPVPKGFPPPVAIGDKLSDGTTIGPLCDKFDVGGHTCWRFYVELPTERPIQVSALVAARVSRLAGTRKTHEAHSSRVKENSQPDFKANLLTA